MAKEKNIRHEKKRDIDDGALIEKYGKDTSTEFAQMINAMLTKPSPNAPAKVVKR